MGSNMWSWHRAHATVRPSIPRPTTSMRSLMMSLLLLKRSPTVRKPRAARRGSASISTPVAASPGAPPPIIMSPPVIMEGCMVDAGAAAGAAGLAGAVLAAPAGVAAVFTTRLKGSALVAAAGLAGAAAGFAGALFVTLPAGFIG
jgi:hypothetical protein